MFEDQERRRNSRKTAKNQERVRASWCVATVMIAALIVIAIAPAAGATITTVLGVFAAMLRGR